jgi:hypothetical protein
MTTGTGLGLRMGIVEWGRGPWSAFIAGANWILLDGTTRMLKRQELTSSS